MIVWPHQCLGDHILCNGLYRALAERSPLGICCLAHNAKNVQHMLSDLAQVALMIYSSETEITRRLGAYHGDAILKIGNHSPKGFDRWKFDREFYRQAGVAFTDRWAKFHVPPIQQVRTNQSRIVFVHDRPQLGAVIAKQPDEIRPNPGVPMFAYLDILLRADEIHCVSSSFAALADSYDLGNRGLFFYPFGREVPAHRNRWQYRNVNGSRL